MTNLNIDLSDLLVLSGTLVALLIAITFAIFTKKQIGNIWFVGFMLSSIIVLIVKFLYNTGYIIEAPHWFKVNTPTGLARSLLIYLYIYYLLRSFNKIHFKHLIHFIPIVLLIIYLLPFYWQSASYKLQVLNREVDNQLGLIPNEFVYVQFTYSFAYLIFSFIELKRFTTRFKSLNKNQKTIVNWVYLLIIGGLVYLFFAAILRYSGIGGDYNYILYQFHSAFLILLCLGLLSLPKLNRIDLSEEKKYKKSQLAEADKEKYIKQIDQLMFEKELFKREDLKLKDVADMIYLPVYLLSQVINEQRGQTFRDYLNEFRIKEALRVLEKSHHQFTIDSIAYESGFNSRSSFYSAFKKITSMTPTEFIAKKSV